MPFPFEKLIAYQKALEWYRQVDLVLKDKSKQISSCVADQIRRAALSISLNLAEGNGRWHIGDKKQFFWIARGSAFECVPLLTILREEGHLSPQEYQALYLRLEELSKMITGLIQYQESRRASQT